MNGLLITIHVIVSVFLILVVLLQVGRGAELGAAFGSVGQAQSQRGQMNFMSKFTTFLAVSFMITSFFLTFQSSQNAGSTALDRVESRMEQPLEAPAEHDAPAPAATAPAEPAAE